MRNEKSRYTHVAQIYIFSFLRTYVNLQKHQMCAGNVLNVCIRNLEDKIYMDKQTESKKIDQKKVQSY